MSLQLRPLEPFDFDHVIHPIVATGFTLSVPDDIGGKGWDRIRFKELNDTYWDEDGRDGHWLRDSRDRHSTVSPNTPLLVRRSPEIDWLLMEHDWKKKDHQMVGQATIRQAPFEFRFVFEWHSHRIVPFLKSDQGGLFRADSLLLGNYWNKLPIHVEARLFSSYGKPHLMLIAGTEGGYRHLETGSVTAHYWDPESREQHENDTFLGE